MGKHISDELYEKIKAVKTANPDMGRGTIAIMVDCTERKVRTAFKRMYEEGCFPGHGKSGPEKDNVHNTELILKVYNKHAGDVGLAAKELGLGRAAVLHYLKDAGVDDTKKLADGNLTGTKVVRRPLPKRSNVKRYILTCAQNNTHINEPVWKNLLALADHYDAEIMVGTFSYNKNAYGKLAVKKDTATCRDDCLWFAPEIEDYIADKRIALAPGLHWCGEMNILPTAINPLSGFDTYTGEASSVFPQVKFAMKSVSSGRFKRTKFMYTTGAVTKMNYVQKRAGLKAEHHHCYGGLIVEVDSKGRWWSRQLNATTSGIIYDLDIMVDGGEVKTHEGVEAITWGDSHVLLLDKEAHGCSMKMLDDLKPKNQFVHDVMLGSVTNHWSRKSMHDRFRRFAKSGGWSDLTKEFEGCIQYLEEIYRPGCTTYLIDSNHDRPWVENWLDLADGRADPKNAILWLKLNTAMYESILEEPYDRKFHVLEHAFQLMGLPPEKCTFLREDQSLILTPSRIECGMHGHLGPNGSRGSSVNLSKLPVKSNIGHCHNAGITDGLYACGVSCETGTDAWYMHGPSSWSHSHIITYPTGKRTIVTVWDGKYSA